MSDVETLRKALDIAMNAINRGFWLTPLDEIYFDGDCGETSDDDRWIENGDSQALLDLLNRKS